MLSDEDKKFWMLGWRKKLPTPDRSGTYHGMVHGVMTWAIPLADDAEYVTHRVGRRGRRQGHRLMAKCPDCGTDMSAGRLHQHLDTVACQRAYQRNN